MIKGNPSLPSSSAKMKFVLGRTPIRVLAILVPHIPLKFAHLSTLIGLPGISLMYAL
jgi:hypothetical protein